MRTQKTLIFLVIVGAILVWGGKAFHRIQNVYLSTISAKPRSGLAEFIGEWNGSAGTTICIKGEGKVDFRNDLLSVQDANVQIQGAYLSIKLPGFNRTMTINSPPRLGPDGLWRMRLDGELFLRTSSDLFV